MSLSLQNTAANSADVSMSVVGAIPYHPLLRRQGTTGSFDRQYVSPTPSSNDNKADWWWANVQADSGVNGNPPANMQIVFFEGTSSMHHRRNGTDSMCTYISGYIFPRGDPDAPEFYIMVDGMFPDGSDFHFILPASSISISRPQ